MFSIEAFSAHSFSHRGKWECVSEHLPLPGVQDDAKVTSDPLLSHSIQNPETGTAITQGQWMARSKWQVRTQIRMYQRSIDPTNISLNRLHQEDRPWAAESPHLWIPRTDPLVPPMLHKHNIHTHSCPMAGSLCVPTCEESESEPLQGSSEHGRNLAWLHRGERKYTNPSIRHHPRESNEETASTWPGFSGLTKGIQSEEFLHKRVFPCM